MLAATKDRKRKRSETLTMRCLQYSCTDRRIQKEEDNEGGSDDDDDQLPRRDLPPSPKRATLSQEPGATIPSTVTLSVFGARDFFFFLLTL